MPTAAVQKQSELIFIGDEEYRKRQIALLILSLSEQYGGQSALAKLLGVSTSRVNDYAGRGSGVSLNDPLYMQLSLWHSIQRLLRVSDPLWNKVMCHDPQASGGAAPVIELGVVNLRKKMNQNPDGSLDPVRELLITYVDLTSVGAFAEKSGLSERRINQMVDSTKSVRYTEQDFVGLARGLSTLRSIYSAEGLRRMVDEFSKRNGNGKGRSSVIR